MGTNEMDSNRASALADTAALTSGSIAPAQHYEQAYRDAATNDELPPWAKSLPNPALVAWLNTAAPGLVRPGARVVVVGCGLGDDVAELCSRGYDASGFDIAPTAIDWARRRFPEISNAFFTADLLALPSRMRHRFDLVVEVKTLQSLPPAMREETARAVCGLCGQRGTVLAVCRARDDAELLEHVQSPPWPLTVSELTGLMELGGLRPLSPVEEISDLDTEASTTRLLRGAFAR